MSEYECVARGPLKLKSDSGVKKKKKKEKSKALELRKLAEVNKDAKELQQHSKEIQRTKAELAFQKMQEKMVDEELSLPKLTAGVTVNEIRESLRDKLYTVSKQKERILQKASKTHKQRVEEFNRHLDGLTEHFDIPKVSWTK